MSPKFNFVIPADLLDRIRMIADEKGVPIATILNQLISDYVNNVDRIAIQDIEQRVTELEKDMSKIKDIVKRKWKKVGCEASLRNYHTRPMNHSGFP